VVEAGATEVLEDTTEVELPGKGSIDSDRDWAVLEGSSESSWVVHGDIGEVRDIGNTTLGAARSISTSVWVVRLGLHLGGLGVGESIVHETTIATLVALGGRAVNELLLREGVERFVLEEVSALHRSGGGESPAGTALSLVLDWGDGTLSSPVDGIWETLHVSSVSTLVVSSFVVSLTIMVSLVVSLVLVLLGVVLESEKFLEFIAGPVGHMVNTPGGIIGLNLVVVIDPLEVLGELLESELVLVLGSVRLAIRSNVGIELSTSNLVNLEELSSLSTLIVGDGGKGSGKSNSSGLFHSFFLFNY
jgi:hypothetical protein